VTKGQKTFNFLIENASSNDLVGTVLKKILFLPKNIGLETRIGIHPISTNEMEFDL